MCSLYFLFNGEGFFRKWEGERGHCANILMVYEVMVFLQIIQLIWPTKVELENLWWGLAIIILSFNQFLYPIKRR